MSVGPINKRYTLRKDENLKSIGSNGGSGQDRRCPEGMAFVGLKVNAWDHGLKSIHGIGCSPLPHLRKSEIKWGYGGMGQNYDVSHTPACPDGSFISGIDARWGEHISAFRFRCKNVKTGQVTTTPTYGSKWTGGSSASLDLADDAYSAGFSGRAAAAIDNIGFIAGDYTGYRDASSPDGAVACCMGEESPYCTMKAQSGQCDTYMKDYCKKYPLKAVCACINSKLASELQDQGMPFCPQVFDNKCVTGGYQTKNMRETTCPDVVDCSVKVSDSSRLIKSKINTECNVDGKSSGGSFGSGGNAADFIKDNSWAIGGGILGFLFLLIIIIIISSSGGGKRRPPPPMHNPYMNPYM